MEQWKKMQGDLTETCSRCPSPDVPGKPHFVYATGTFTFLCDKHATSAEILPCAGILYRQALTETQRRT